MFTSDLMISSKDSHLYFVESLEITQKLFWNSKLSAERSFEKFFCSKEYNISFWTGGAEIWGGTKFSCIWNKEALVSSSCWSKISSTIPVCSCVFLTYHILSANSLASRQSCEENRISLFCSLASLLNVLRIMILFFSSRWVVGSSRIIIGEFWVIARPIKAFWRFPSERFLSRVYLYWFKSSSSMICATSSRSSFFSSK